MKYLSILAILLIFGCKVNQQVNKNETTVNEDWSVTSEKKYENTDAVDIQITNNTENNLVIFDPFVKRIEKFDGENWTKIRVPYCACGNCPPPPEVMPISSKEKHTFTWNKNIDSCKNGRKTSKKMESGRYRVIFNYGTSQNVRSFEKLIVEFEI